MTMAAEISYRPLALADLESVPLQCQGEPAEIVGRIQRCGSSALLAFDGPTCVGQLQFRPYVAGSRSPNGLHHPIYWMDLPDGTPVPAEPALALFCYHVGQLAGDPERRDPRYLGRGIGQALLREALAWARQHGFASVVAKGLAPCWPLIQYMGGMPWPVYEAQGFALRHRYHDAELRTVLDELCAGRYGDERAAELQRLADAGADLDALAEVRVYVHERARN
ncbi:MAG TPA: GNAT family N-acetyltransferase [Dehalococcoidia bacterium]|nr:GNAT family N-acetyltransferase [Dehalococcoidia bacterium]